MKNYNVHIEISECESADFTIEAPDLPEAQYKAVEEAISLGYDPDDITTIDELCPKCGEKLILDQDTYKYVCPTDCEEETPAKVEVRQRLKSCGFSLYNFDEDYDLAKDNYKEIYGPDDPDFNPENCDDFPAWCQENWTENETIQKIRKEISTWNVEEFSDATDQDIIDHVLCCIEYQDETLEEAIESANQAMVEGNL